MVLVMVCSVTPTYPLCPLGHTTYSNLVEIIALDTLEEVAAAAMPVEAPVESASV